MSESNEISEVSTKYNIHNFNYLNNKKYYIIGNISMNAIIINITNEINLFNNFKIIKHEILNSLINKIEKKFV